MHFSTVFFEEFGAAVNKSAASAASPEGLQAEKVGWQGGKVLESSRLVCMHGFGPQGPSPFIFLIFDFQAVIKSAASAASPEGFGRGKAGQALGPAGRGSAGPMAFPLPSPSGEAALAADLIMA